MGPHQSGGGSSLMTSRLIISARNSDFPKLDVPILRMIFERRPRPPQDETQTQPQQLI
jgi:hypothetical protein